MKRVKEIKEFRFKNEVKTAESEIEFSSNDVLRRVCFDTLSDEVCVDLVRYNTQNVNQFLLREGKELTKEELVKMSTDFRFDLVPHHLHAQIFSGVIPNLVGTFGNTYFGSISRNDERFYLIIFGKRGATKFDENIYYIHGIWEVKLDDEEEAKFFGSENF